MVTSVTGGAGTSATPSSSLTALSNNYELFLSILTTQIQNQDPLDPMDSSQYTEQLVQYSSVEQQIKTNDQLESMLQVLAASTASSYVSYLGTEIVATGGAAEHTGSGASWTYNSTSSGPARVEIKNAAGATIFAETTDIESGRNSYSWDGRTTSGSTAPNGTYTVTIARLDANGNPTVAVPTETRGTVTGLEFADDGPMLKIGDISVPAANVISVNRI